MASFSKPRRTTGVAHLPQAFRRHHFESYRVGPEARMLWDLWFADPTKEHFDALFNFYANLVMIEAFKLKKRNPDLYRDDVDELISDGCMGLMRAIHRRKRFATGMMKFLRMDIRDSIRRNLRRRLWGGETRSLNTSIIRTIRRRLTQQLGRLGSCSRASRR